MHASIVVRASAAKIWKIWESGYAQRGQLLAEGTTGDVQKMSYRIAEVEPGVRFAMVWKAYFVRLVLLQSLRATDTGTEICYEMQVKGFLAAPVRWMLRGVVRKQLEKALQLFAKQLHGAY